MKTKTKSKKKVTAEKFREQMLIDTKKIGVEAVNICESLPNNHAGEAIGEQLLQAAMSVGMKYRAITRINDELELKERYRGVGFECEKAEYWIELLVNLKLIEEGKYDEILKSIKKVFREIKLLIK